MRASTQPGRENIRSTACTHTTRCCESSHGVPLRSGPRGTIALPSISSLRGSACDYVSRSGIGFRTMDSVFFESVKFVSQRGVRYQGFHDPDADDDRL